MILFMYLLPALTRICVCKTNESVECWTGSDFEKKGSFASVVPKAAFGDDQFSLQLECNRTAIAQTVFDGMVRASWFKEHVCSGTPTLSVFSQSIPFASLGQLL